MTSAPRSGAPQDGAPHDGAPLDGAPPDPALVAALRAAGCVFAEEEAALITEAAAGDPVLVAALRERRIGGEPLEYVVGRVDFDGHRLGVVPGVFIPRQRSLLAVERAVAALPDAGSATLVDLGCGCGALGYAVARRRPDTTVHAVDVDPVAAACARANLSRLPGGTAHVHCGDLLAPLPEEVSGAVDVILASLPYVPTSARGAMPAESRDHEPAGTTDGGSDGLDLIRRALAQATPWLHPEGALVLEVGAAGTGQAARLSEMATGHGWRCTITEDAESGGCVVIARRARSRHMESGPSPSGAPPDSM